MFRSKSFTAAFIALSILIVGLIAVLCYMIFGKNSEAIFEPKAISTEEAAASSEEPSSEEAETPEETTTEETVTETETETETETTVPETEPDYSVRALSPEEEHVYPVVGEEIPMNGLLTITKPGDNGEGLVFHGKPEFDAWDTEGNVTNYNGSYNVNGKIYIMNNGQPFLMYKTADQHYVTSSTAYVSFQDYGSTVAADPQKIGPFGANEQQGLLAEIISDDGNHVVFSMYDYNNETGEKSPVLENIIARYAQNGVADFEYHNSDGLVHSGTIAFESVSGQPYTKLVDIVFTSPVAFKIAEMTEIVLHN